MKERGLAFLETAMVAAVLLPLLLGAVALITFMQESGVVQEMVHQAVADGTMHRSGQMAPPPLALDSRGNLTLRAQALDSFLVSLVNSVESDLVQSLSSGRRRYWIEASYGTLPIDTATGASLGTQYLALGSVVQRGALGRGELPEVESLLRDYIHSRDGELSPGSASTFAVPRAFLGMVQAQARFLSPAVFVVLRVRTETRDPWVGDILTQLSGDGIIEDTKITVLRSEVA